MHYTEWLFIILLGISIVFVVVGPGKIGVTPISALLLFASFVAFIMTWGFAKFKSLAAVADKLEGIARETHAEVSCYADINDEWEDGLKRSRDNIHQFTQQMGLVTDDAEQIKALTEGLTGLVEQQKLIQAEERALHEISVKHQKVTRADIDEKQRANMKKNLERVFKRLAKRGPHGELEITSEESIAKLREALQENEFLNSKKLDKHGNETDEPKYNWLSSFDKIVRDGAIEAHEVLDALDECTNAYFLEIRDAIQIRKKLQEELHHLQREKEKRR